MARLKRTLEQNLPFILLIGGAIGYACAFIIMFDKLKILADPSYVPSCSINPVISCGSIMESAQSHAFGFPNPFLGLGGFPIVATIGAALLAGAKFKRWFWLSLNAGLLFAVGFVHWLFYESVYSIHALCPWCMVVWTVSIICFWYVTLYNLDKKHLALPKGKPQKIYTWIRKHHLDLLILWFVIIGGLILKHFWYYYGQHFLWF